MKKKVASTVCLLAFVAFAFPVFAQIQAPAPVAPNPVSTVVAIDINPIIQAIATLFATVIIPLIGLWVRKHFQIKEDDKAYKVVESALQHGVALAASRIGPVSVQTKHQILAEAIQYVNSHAGDAVERLKIDQSILAEKVESRLAVAVQDKTNTITEVASNVISDGQPKQK